MYVNVFPCFRLSVSDLQYVSHFKYLGHIITHNLSDDNDMQREIRSIFVRCNVLIRKFSNCSLRVKVKLFKSLFFMILRCGLRIMSVVCVMFAHVTTSVYKKLISR